MLGAASRRRRAPFASVSSGRPVRSRRSISNSSAAGSPSRVYSGASTRMSTGIVPTSVSPSRMCTRLSSVTLPMIAHGTSQRSNSLATSSSWPWRTMISIRSCDSESITSYGVIPSFPARHLGDVDLDAAAAAARRFDGGGREAGRAEVLHAGDPVDGGSRRGRGTLPAASSRGTGCPPARRGASPRSGRWGRCARRARTRRGCRRARCRRRRASAGCRRPPPSR